MRNKVFSFSTCKGVFMSNVMFASDEQIYKAAVADAERGYNRSTDNHSKYEEVIEEHYKAMLSEVVNKSERRRIQKHTGNNWRKAYLPLSMALVNKHMSSINLNIFRTTKKPLRGFLVNELYRSSFHSFLFTLQISIDITQRTFLLFNNSFEGNSFTIFDTITSSSASTLIATRTNTSI